MVVIAVISAFSVIFQTKLEVPVKKGKAVTKTELIKRAIDEFISNHPELFWK